MDEDCQCSSGKIILSVSAVCVGFCLYLYRFKHKHALKLFLLAVFLSLLMFGLYSLYNILKGVWEFDNSKGAYQHLVKELKVVEMDLKKLGFPFEKFNINLKSSTEEY